MNNDIDTLINLPAKTRLDAIINHPTPLKLVQAMSPQDVLVSINEIGKEDCLEVLELLGPTQVQGMLDLSIWHNHRLNIKKTGEYLCLLFEASPAKALKQIHSLDIELLGLMFKLVSEIYDTTLNEEPADYPEHYLISPDGRFIVCFRPKENFLDLSRALQQFLTALYERDLTFALRLLEAVRFELASGLEEEALRWRNNRLMDLGILPKEERLIYFSPLKEAKSKQAINNISSEKLSLRHFTSFKDKHQFFMNALNLCSNKRQQQCHEELTHAVINMHAELSEDFSKREELINTATYVKTLIEFGLFKQSKGILNDAAICLSSMYLKDLIRLGRTSLLELRKHLSSLSKNDDYLLGHDFILADAPLQEVARALFLKEPMFYQGLIDATKFTSKYFSSLTELDLSIKAVAELKFRALFVGPSLLKANPQIIEKFFKEGLAPSHASIFARALLNNFYNRSEIFLAPSELEVEKAIKDNKFNDSCRSFAQPFAEKRPELAEQIYHFTTSVLATLEQNYRLLI